DPTGLHQPQVVFIGFYPRKTQAHFIAAVRSESGRWRYALFAAAYTTAIAYLAAWGTYMLFR
ncbi:MAG: hypothetical protein ACI3ZA_07440, partial [Alloprevotella sp.]